GDDWVVVFTPRGEDAADFIRRVRAGHRQRPSRPTPAVSERPLTPCPPNEVRKRFAVMPRLEAVAVQKGEQVCTNEDLIRNAAWCWSPMTAEEIHLKTGIAQRLYTDLDLDHLALMAARRALEKSGRRPGEIGAVVFCSCTSAKMMPSVATWLSGQLGIFQPHASSHLFDAAQAVPYGMREPRG